MAVPIKLVSQYAGLCTQFEAGLRQDQASTSRIVRPLAAALAALLTTGCAMVPGILQTASLRSQAEAAQHKSDQQRRQLDEFMRLQRLGRFDEARILAQELNASLGLARTDLLLGSLDQTLRSIEQMQDIQADSEPLFVRPLWLHVANDGEAWLRLAPDVRELIDRALARMAAGDQAAARMTLQQAGELTYTRHGAAHPDQLVILEQLAHLDHDQQHSDAALAHLRSAMALARQMPAATLQWSVPLLMQEADLLHERGDTDGAQAAVREAQAALRDAPAADPSWSISIDNDLGVLLARRGDPVAAQRAYEAAYEKLQALPSVRPFALPEPSASVEEQARAALERSRSEPPWWLAPQLLSNLGLVRWQQGDTGGALVLFAHALDMRARFDVMEQPGDNEAAMLARAAVAGEELNALVALEQSAPPDAPRPGLQFLFERKGALLERQARSMALLRRDADAPAVPGRTRPPLLGGYRTQLRRVQAETEARTRAENRDLFEQYRLAQSQRANLEGQRPLSPEDAEARARASAELDRRLWVMQREIEQRQQQTRYRLEMPALDPAALGRQNPARLSAQLQEQADLRERRRREQRTQLLPEIQARIPAGAVLIEMLTVRPLALPAGAPAEAQAMAPRYAAWLIRRNGEPAYLDLGPAALVDALVAELRKALSYPDSLEQARTLGRRLDALVMAPVRQAAGDSTVLLVAPEGQLNLIPFEALVEESGHFLIERLRFNYLASGRDLLRYGADATPRGTALILANPEFGSGPVVQAPAQDTPEPQPRARDFAGMFFEPLPATAIEAATIKALLPDAVLLTGPQATESALKRVRGPRLLHLATHGFFLGDTVRATARERAGLPRENPMLRSGLVFAGVSALQSEQDDGVLTALEAAGLDLDGTQLVVLSACETGLGAVRNGEGVFGLRRAFVVAGAQTLVMSLWQVDDESTQRLMSDYYRRLAVGADRVEALRSTQLALLADPSSRHPFYWASFIISGQDGPLR
jgi:CHAT domain-containing protein